MICKCVSVFCHLYPYLTLKLDNVAAASAACSSAFCLLLCFCCCLSACVHAGEVYLYLNLPWRSEWDRLIVVVCVCIAYKEVNDLN